MCIRDRDVDPNVGYFLEVKTRSTVQSVFYDEIIRGALKVGEKRIYEVYSGEYGEIRIHMFECMGSFVLKAAKSLGDLETNATIVMKVNEADSLNPWHSIGLKKKGVGFISIEAVNGTEFVNKKGGQPIMFAQFKAQIYFHRHQDPCFFSAFYPNKTDNLAVEFQSADQANFVWRPLRGDDKKLFSRSESPIIGEPLPQVASNTSNTSAAPTPPTTLPNKSGPVVSAPKPAVSPRKITRKNSVIFWEHTIHYSVFAARDLTYGKTMAVCGYCAFCQGFEDMTSGPVSMTKEVSGVTNHVSRNSSNFTDTRMRATVALPPSSKDQMMQFFVTADIISANENDPLYPTNIVLLAGATSQVATTTTPTRRVRPRILLFVGLGVIIILVFFAVLYGVFRRRGEAEKEASSDSAKKDMEMSNKQ
eukprot:TRINITY_DN8194_c0_g1_i1.p1 TRINITY_DN8194_c0_g1~~TRINITY_DN8194_c0_g1_i1.p1  ORF type:complete len:447 (+),score=58.40 TRINITY_DN8194_c0_g1_i1:86-1342(+)